MRDEKDSIGTVSLPEDALYGIHAWRSAQNFPDNTPFQEEWFRAMGLVKQACYRCIIDFHKAATKHYPEKALPAGMEDITVFGNLEKAAEEVSLGKHFRHFIVPAVQGGAGTSINMNINEIIANVALTKKGLPAGAYQHIDPYRHANLFQSTNDVVPTALKVAAMHLLQRLEDGINTLRAQVERLENAHRSSLRIAFTQMQQALPSSYGMLFSAYSEALSRDWWRVSKCFERIKVVNLGGGATGTGMAIPRYFLMEVVPQLQKLTNLPVTRSENLCDTTQNLDALVEVHAILKAHAVNLEKMAADIRLLSSGLSQQPDIMLPAQQTGSSIMPGKVNPVIPEFVISAAHKVYSNDMLISSLCGQGNLDLNAYLPLIGHALLDSLNLLIAADKSIHEKLFSVMKVQESDALQKLMHSPTITTALIPYINYENATALATYMKQHDCNILEANKALSTVDHDKLVTLLKPENLLKLGYSLKG